MTARLSGCLGALSLLAACDPPPPEPPPEPPPQAEVVMAADINGANANSASFAIFDELIEVFDLDGDGVDDVELTTLLVFASDQEDLCAQFAADPEALDNLLDVQAVEVLAFKADAPGEGGFGVGDFTTTATLDVLLGQVPVGEVFVDGVVFVREGGVDKINAQGQGIFDAASLSVGALGLDAFAETLSGDFTMTLAGDFADEATFDVDLDGDGVNDALLVDVNLDAVFSEAVFCDAIL